MNHHAEQSVYNVELSDGVLLRVLSVPPRSQSRPAVLRTGQAMRQGQWACDNFFFLGVFFSFCSFLFHRNPEFASLRFDSGVSILVAAFVRPDVWVQIQGPEAPVAQ